MKTEENNKEYWKNIIIERANIWIRTHLPRVMDYYPDSDTVIHDMLNEDIREEFIKAISI